MPGPTSGGGITEGGWLGTYPATGQEKAPPKRDHGASGSAKNLVLGDFMDRRRGGSFAGIVTDPTSGRSAAFRQLPEREDNQAQACNYDEPHYSGPPCCACPFAAIVSFANTLAIAAKIHRKHQKNPNPKRDAEFFSPRFCCLVMNHAVAALIAHAGHPSTPKDSCVTRKVARLKCQSATLFIPAFPRNLFRPFIPASLILAAFEFF